MGRLIAAALNSLYLAIVSDAFPSRRLQPPYVADCEAVVQLDSGELVYVTGPPAPYGRSQIWCRLRARSASRFPSA